MVCFGEQKKICTLAINDDHLYCTSMPPLLHIQKPRKYSAPDHYLTKNEFNNRIGFDNLSPFNYRLFYISIGSDRNHRRMNVLKSGGGADGATINATYWLKIYYKNLW